jgi:hypothetical protein
MSVAETNREIAENEVAETYIRSLSWSEDATDWERTLVAGNIRGFWDHIKKRNKQAIQEMRKALENNQRVNADMERQSAASGNESDTYRSFGRWQLCVELLCYLDEIEKDISE